MNNWKKTIGGVLDKVLFAALILLVLLLLGTKLPIPGNYRLLIVQSGSMEPAIPTGAVVFVAPQSSYKAGEVITYGLRRPTPVTHRILEAKDLGNGETYVTKGDANDAADMAEVPLSDVIGRVLFHVPFVGYAIAAVRKPWGFALIIGLPALYIIFEEVKKIIAEMRARKLKTVNDNEAKV